MHAASDRGRAISMMGGCAAQQTTHARTSHKCKHQERRARRRAACSAPWGRLPGLQRPRTRGSRGLRLQHLRGHGRPRRCRWWSARRVVMAMARGRPPAAAAGAARTPPWRGVGRRGWRSTGPPRWTTWRRTRTSSTPVRAHAATLVGTLWQLHRTPLMGKPRE